MDTDAARRILARELDRYRSMPHSALADLIGAVGAIEVDGGDGITYQIEIEILWDTSPGGDLRVIGSIDDGGWRAFVPLSDDFIMTPEGRFRGE